MGLTQAAAEKKHLVTIMVDSEQSALEMSQILWQSDATKFVPNVLGNHRLAAETPVVIDWGQEKELYQDDILINVTSEQLRQFSRFQTLIELVSTKEEDRAAARMRYKFYRDRGYEIKHVDYQVSIL